MTPEIRELVDRRWDEYGIPVDPAARNGRMRHISRPLHAIVTSLTLLRQRRLNPGR